MNAVETRKVETRKRVRIGAGRASVVYRSSDEKYGEVAIKVFCSSLFFNIVNYVAKGAPNPYIHNEDVVWAAHYRRILLNDLLKITDIPVRVAKSYGVHFNEEFRSFELHTEFIDGRHAALHHPYTNGTDLEITELVENVMKPLQRILPQIGFDGANWQAGFGVPPASANFIKEKKTGKWVLIDLESGVPAIGSPNLYKSATYYLPKSWRHRGLLFDDIDIDKVREFVYLNRISLVDSLKDVDEEHALHNDKFETLLHNIDKVAFHQDRWRSTRRSDRAVTYLLVKGKISKDTAQKYYDRPQFAWYAREATRLSAKIYSLPQELGNLVEREVMNFLLEKAVPLTKKFASLAWNLRRRDYRDELAQTYMLGRIEAWEARSQLDTNAASYLRSQVNGGQRSVYIVDQLMVLGLKGADWPITIVALAAGVSGEVNGWLAGLLAFMGGSMLRTGYTLSRMGVTYARMSHLKKILAAVPRHLEQCMICLRKGALLRALSYFPGNPLRARHAVALLVGLIPVVGTANYSAQMAYFELTADRAVGSFLLYDIFSRLGANVPLWGGSDSLLEHAANHLPNFLIKDRQVVRGQLEVSGAHGGGTGAFPGVGAL